MGTRKLALIAALAVSALVPAASQAATVSEPQTSTLTVDFGGHQGIQDIPVYTLKFEASPGEANDVTLGRDLEQPSYADAVIVKDAGAPLEPGANCDRVSGGVECAPPVGTFMDAAGIQLGDGDDRFFITTGIPNVHVFGGPGADDLRSDGDDVTLSGGSGPDRIEGLGGEGVASYAGRVTGVSVSLDGTANDGAPGEGDDVEGTIKVIGGSGPDVLTAPQGPDALGMKFASGPGDDVVTGGAGGDHLEGGPGRDQVLGNAGDDVIVGAADPDAVDGGEGRDRLNVRTNMPARVSLDPARGDATFTHASGIEELRGGSGPDLVIGSDSAEAIDETPGGRDLIYAGGGDDRITTSGFPGSYVDAGSGKDVVSLSGLGDQAALRDEEQDDLRCVHFAVRTVVERDAFDTTTSCTPFVFFPRAGLLRPSPRGVIAIPLACPLVDVCTGTLELIWRGRAIVTRSFSRKPYSTSHVRFKLPRAAREELRKGRGLRMTLALEVRLHAEPAATHAVSRRITVLPARRR
jgi:hypothetical protein